MSEQNRWDGQIKKRKGKEAGDLQGTKKENSKYSRVFSEKRQELDKEILDE